MIYRQKSDGIIGLFLAHCKHFEYQPRQEIIHAGKASNHLYYIVKGSVSVFVENEQHKQILLAYLHPEEFFGEMGLFEEQPYRSAFVMAKTKTHVARISYDKLKNLHYIFPEVLFLVASQMAIRLRRTSGRVKDLVFTDAKGRIAKALLDLCKEPNVQSHAEGVKLNITRQEISHIAGCSRELVGKVLKSLDEDDHLISVSGKTIIVFWRSGYQLKNR